MKKTETPFVKYVTNFTPWLIFGLIIILGIGLRVSHYTSKAMWGDEFFVLIVAKRSFLGIVQTLHCNIHQPLYYLVVKILSYFSRSDAVRKLPSLISAIATLIVFFPIVKRLADTKVALVATLLLACNTEHIRYSQMLRMYTMVTLFSLLSTYYLYRFLETKGDRKAMWLYIVSMALAFHTHINSAFVFIFQMLYLVYVSIEGFLIRAYNQLKDPLAKNKFEGLYFLSFSVFALVLFLGNLILLRHISPTGVATSRGFVFVSAVLLFLGGSGVASLLSIRFFYKEKLLKPFIDLPLVKKGILMALLLVAVCPIFIYCLSGSLLFYFPHHRKSPIQTWSPLGMSELVHNFQFILSGQAPGYILKKFPREVFYRAFLFPLGIFLAFLKGKRWIILFALYSLSFYIYIFMVGYSKISISLGTRHFLLTLPAIIMFVAIGLVWGLEYVWNIFAKIIAFLSRITRLSNLIKISATHKKITNKLLCNIFVIVFVVGFFIQDTPAILTDIRWWHEQKWEDWHTFGKFLNTNLKPGTLIFFRDHLAQYNASVNTDARTEDLIFHSKNSALDKRVVWQVISYDDKLVKQLIQQGFKSVLTISPGETHILEKTLEVKSPILITKTKNGIWEFNSDFNFHDYSFVSYFDSIERISLRTNYYAPACLAPTDCNEICSITYRFKVKDKVKVNYFIVMLDFVLIDASSAKLKFSLNNKDFIDIASIVKSGNYRFDITPQIQGTDSFYVRCELFAKRLPIHVLDGIDSVFLTRIGFKALVR